jgi:hypothetical protein
MRVTDFTRSVLTFRRERTAMRAAGFDSFTDWRMVRGGLMKKRIVEAIVSADGQRIYYRIEGAEGRERRETEA